MKKINLSAIELLQINESAKALKQRAIVYIHGYIIGIDEISSYIIYTKINPSLVPDYINIDIGFMISCRELSAFCKTITSEQFFILDTENLSINRFTTFAGGELNIITNRALSIDCFNRLKSIEFDINNHNQSGNYNIIGDFDITQTIEPLFSMKRADGVFNLIYQNFYMTIPVGLLPLSKSDKVSVTIKDYVYSNTFISRFTVKKKKSIGDIVIYVNYLKLPNQSNIPRA